MVAALPKLVTKMLAPRRRGDTVCRRRLLDHLLHYQDCRLQLVCAPAGFGKTTLMVDFASEVRRPVCWYTLDQSDIDPVAFLDYLVDAIRTRFPGFGKETQALLASVSDVGRESDSVLRVLVQDIRSNIPEPFILVLEDYHHVDANQTLNSLMDSLLEKAPDNCHLVVTSRVMPRFQGLPRLMARREVAALGLDDLRFTPEEVVELFYAGQGVRLGQEEAAQLTSNSEGWIAGLILTNRIFWKGLLKHLVECQGRSSALFDYLSQEVYNGLSDELKRFLLATSILSELEAQFCNELLGVENSQDFMDEVERRNLFLSRLSSERPVYGFHQLFQDFLKAKLKGENLKGYLGLHSKAAGIYEKRGCWEGAIRHYREAESWEEYARLVADAGEQLTRAGRWKTLSEWIDRLPQNMLVSNHRLLLWRAQAALRTSDNDLAVKLSNQAMDESAKRGDPRGMAQALLCRGAALRVLGQPKAATADTRRALRALRDETEETRLLAEARRQLGTTYGQWGDFARAKQQLKKALALYIKAGELQDISRVRDLLGIACSQLGQLTEATTHFEWARQGWLKLSNWSELARTQNNLGELFRLKGDYERALSELEGALLNSRRSGHTRSEAYTLKTMGDVKQDLGEYHSAIETFNDSLELAKRALDAHLVAECGRALANSYRLMGSYEKAEFLIDQAICQAEETGSGYDLGLSLSILGLIRCLQDRHQEAVAALNKATRLIQRSGNKRELARTYLYLAQAHLLVGNYTGAARDLTRMVPLLEELGSAEFLVADATRTVSVIEYAASKRIGGTQFAKLLERLRCGRKGPGPSQDLGSYHALPRVEALAFGPGRVLVDGREVSEPEWRSRKSRELLFYLLAHRRGAAKEQIFEALWPEWSPDKLNSCFHPTVYRLREAVHRTCLTFQSRRYVLNPDGDFYYDVEEFERLMSEAEQLPRGTESRAARLQRVIGLYKGPFLEDFYSEWCETLRRDLENRYVRALASLGGYYAAKGQYDKAIELLEKCLAIDSLQDDVQYELMNAYFLAGNVGGAIRCYQHYADVLKRDLGVEPPAQIRQLLLGVVGKD